jgi:pantoate--beta-alanine ligase
VNPIQFNNPEDLKKYPVTFEQDAEMLKKRGCAMLFYPSVEEMYPEVPKESYDFGHLEHVMEGRFRPGHFQGVGIVVNRLFDIVQPDLAFFGEKDYQQLLVIQKLIEITESKITIIPCPTVREADGLAMSSRNVRLSPAQRLLAPQIYRILTEASLQAASLDVMGLKDWVRLAFEAIAEFRLEYYEVSDAKTLQPISTWEQGREVVTCIATYLGDIRLIDNVRFICNFAR